MLCRGKLHENRRAAQRIQTAFADAHHYTPTDDTLIPTGDIKPVKDTPCDFTKATKMGARIAELKGEPVGYEVNYVLDRPRDDRELPLAAIVARVLKGALAST